MTPKVLLVDDDKAWLEMMQQELAGYAGAFAIETAGDGRQALEILAAEDITVVVSDLRMPGIDGFDLLSRILKQYPGISVLIVTAYDRPKTRDVIFKSGADDYMTKPVAAADLAGRINGLLKKKSEGGSLHNVSLETFLQLIEMEQQTCTLRVENKDAAKTGVLFFRDGELMNARFGGRQGKDAAYEIFSWSGVSVSIENRCPVTEKRMEGGLQAILLDAMRTKDEGSEDFSPEEDTEAAENEILLDTPVQQRQTAASAGKTPKPSKAQPPSGAKRKPPGSRQKARAQGGRAAPASGVERIREKIDRSLGKNNGVEDIYEDPQWRHLIEQIAAMGAIFNTGGLSAVYLNKGSQGQSVIVPAGDRPAVILMNPETSRDRVIDAVM